MKKSSLSVILGSLLGVVLVFGFQMEEAELAKRMKGVGKGMGAVKKGNKTADMAMVGEGADAIATNLDGTEKFWAAHKVADAVKMSTEGVAAAKALSVAAKAGDAAAVKEAAAKLGASCKGCHDQYREKVGENEYKVKLPAH